VIYPKNFEEKIGFDKIRELLKEKCLSDLGKERVEQIKFARNFEFIQICLNQTNEFKQICIFENEFPVSNYIDVRRYLSKIRIEGAYLEVNELFDFKRSLDAIKAVINFFASKKEEQYPYLRRLTGNVKVFPVLIEKIETIINKHGFIRDNASPELSSIRRSILSKQAGISKIMNQILIQAKAEGWVEEDSSITIRDGRMLIPVPSTYKRKVKGFVFDESATGKTSFIEPLEIIEENNEIRELEFAERREITKILTGFSNVVRPYIEELVYSYDFLGWIDFIRAKALLAIEIEGVLPHFVNEGSLEYRVARHPLLMMTFRKEGKKVVPLDIALNEKQRILIISGPNAGGKSVCLKTVGLLQYMFQCGLLIPVHDNSAIGYFENIFIDIGDEQSIENDLSTYSSHLMNMKFFVENSDKRTLFLIDEFGTGTEPLHGGAIAESVLERINRNKAMGVITTHYTNLKHFATSNEGIVNGAMLYDNQKMEPVFQLETGIPGSSFAFEIAAKIGLPTDIINRATEKIGKDHVDFDRHLRDIERDKKETSELKIRLQQKENEMDQTLEKYYSELENTIKQRKNILKITHEQVNDIIGSVNKQIENTIFEIKSAKAEKEKTKEVRTQLDDFVKDTQEKRLRDLSLLEEKLDELENSIISRHQSLKTKEKITKPKEIVDSAIKVGDSVKISKQEATGEIIDLKGDEAVVSFGNMQMILKISQLEKISKSDAEKIQPKTYRTLNSIGFDIHKRKLHFKHDIDVRGKRADEALHIIMEYIDEALVVEARELKILHGTGTGALRQIIRDYLRTVDVVKSVRDELVEYGGAGITVVQLNF
jgi:DNA mismatch repair protein MutS2